MRTLYAIAAVSMLAASACREDKLPEPAEAHIEVNEITDSSVQFTVAVSNAVSYSYSCTEKLSEDSAEYTAVENGEGGEHTVGGLKPQTEYVLLAYAVNSEGQISDIAREEFTTEKGLDPTATISVVEVGSDSVCFTISAQNASSYRYAVIKDGSADSEYTAVDSPEERSITVKGLEPDTKYAISAFAKDDKGNEGGEAREEFTTSAPEDIPSVTGIGVEPGEVSAVITVTTENAARISYCCIAGTGAAKPVETDFTDIAAETGTTEITITGLEADTDYTVWAFADDNYNGAQSAGFRTVPAQKGPLAIEVSDITMTDATVTVTFDSSEYTEYYLYTDLEENFAWGFSWTDAMFFAISGNASGEYTLSEIFGAPLVTSGKYILMGIALDSNGDLVQETEIEVEVQLKEAVLGESPVTAEISIIGTTHNSITYSVNSDDAASYYFKSVRSDYIYGSIESYIADNMLSDSPRTDFGTSKTVNSLKADTEYTLIAVPVSSDGKLGNYVSTKVRTEPVTLDGIGTATVENLTAGAHSVTMDLTLDANTEQVKYMAIEPGMYPDDAAIATALITNLSAESVTESGTVTITGLQESTAYLVCIVALDKSGKWGGYQKLEITTKEFLLDGNATVTISEPTYVASGNFGEATFTITPDSNCQMYYYGYLADYMVDGKTDKEIVRSMLSKSTGKGEQTISGMFVSKNSYIIVVPVDKESRYCTPVMKQCPSSF